MGHTDLRVAITADWMATFGGGERVLMELHRLFPDAPIYTSVYNPDALPPEMHGWDVRTSFLQKIPFAKRKYQAFLPLMPLAFEQFDLREYDVVLTTNHACAKGVITRSDALNLCYCYTPCRYIWDLYHDYTRDHRARVLMAPVAHKLRIWDRLAADRVDHFMAISGEVAGRIRKHYRRDSEIVYPPVDVERLTPSTEEPEDFYLVVSRLVGYKRVDLAVEACTQLGRRLIVVGEGPERKRLEQLAGPTVEFLGRQDDEAVAELYGRCRALLFPGHEDFGIVPVEVQARGRPVVAYGKGGARETVIDGHTGVHFPQQTVHHLVRAMQLLEGMHISAEACRENAERFSAAVFRRAVMAAFERHVSAGGRRAEDAPPLPIAGIRALRG